METADLPEKSTTDNPQAASISQTPHQGKQQLLARLAEVERYWQEGVVRAEAGSAWSEYARLLNACKDVIEHAPLHPNEVRQIDDPVPRIDYALERLATTLATILPGGLHELEYFLVDDAARERRRQAALTRKRKPHAETKGEGSAG